jgi:hypothetical protein
VDGQPQLRPFITQLSDGQSRIPAIFQISDSQPESIERSKRQLGPCLLQYLTLTLDYASLFDQDGRYGYIAGENHQFQFDNPVQDGGYGQFNFSICQGTIAFNGSTNWWKCDSGAGFYNLYDTEISIAACQMCQFIVIPCM